MISGMAASLLPMIFGIAIGFGLPIQTAINSQLRKVLRSPFKASLVSFIVGTLVLWLIVTFAEGGSNLPEGFVAAEPWWIWLGGVLGVLFLTGNILLFPKLGAVQTVVMPILGQIIASNVIDMGGWFGLTAHPMTGMRAFGILLAIVGIVFAVVLPDFRPAGIPSTQGRAARGNGNNLRSVTRGLWLWQVAGIILGAISAGQTAINGHLGSELGSAILASFISFIIGLLLLTVIVVLQEAFGYARLRGRRASRNETAQGEDSPEEFDTVATARPGVRWLTLMGKTPWWTWVGGLLGALFVFGNSYLAPVLGAGLTVVIVLLGQICGGLAVDRFGLLHAPKRAVTAMQMLGVAVLLAGAIIVRLF
jgi:transporter family-2 protein